MSDLFLSFVFIIILLLLVSCLEDGILLIILGIVVLIATLNLETLFTITDSSLVGLGVSWGNVLWMAYLSTSIFCFAKSIGTAHSIGMFQGKK